ncbi:hypothetical protein [Thermococcus sp.]
MKRVRIIHVLILYFLMLILSVGVRYIFEGTYNILDSAIFSGLWVAVFLLLVLSIEKIQRKHREPYIIGDSNKIEHLTARELEERLKEKC